MNLFLASVPGRCKTLLDRLTSARADKLDFLDGLISSRAPASTAVSNADLTPARAAKLSNLIETSVLNSNIQTGYAASLPGAGAGEDNYYLDVTVSAVVIAKTLVIVQSVEQAGSAISGRMTSTTNLRVSGGEFARGRWYIIEFK